MIGEIITGVFTGIKEIRALIDGGKTEAAKAALDAMEKNAQRLHEVDFAQIEVNKAEAQNANIFVSGWRPFVGWVCATAFAYHFIVQPFMVFMMAAFGNTFPVPAFAMDTLNTVLAGLLGLGGFRTVEKVKGVAK